MHIYIPGPLDSRILPPPPLEKIHFAYHFLIQMDISEPGRPRAQIPGSGHPSPSSPGPLDFRILLPFENVHFTYHFLIQIAISESLLICF